MIFPNIKVQPYWLKTLEAAADAPVVLQGWKLVKLAPEKFVR